MLIEVKDVLGELGLTPSLGWGPGPDSWPPSMAQSRFPPLLAPAAPQNPFHVPARRRLPGPRSQGRAEGLGLVPPITPAPEVDDGVRGAGTRPAGL